jgi:hypothetical protein
LIIKKGHDLRKPGLALGHAQQLSDLAIKIGQSVTRIACGGHVY